VEEADKENSMNSCSQEAKATRSRRLKIAENTFKIKI
jgi:hypothetical protein